MKWSYILLEYVYYTWHVWRLLLFMTKALLTNIVLLGFERLHGIVSHARVVMYAAISGSEGRTFGDFLWGILETRVERFVSKRQTDSPDYKVSFWAISFNLSKGMYA